MRGASSAVTVITHSATGGRHSATGYCKGNWGGGGGCSVFHLGEHR